MNNSNNLFTNAFVDLMASALGCIVILMLVFSVKKPVASSSIGKPRGFVYYSVEVEDTCAKLELYFTQLSAYSDCPTVHYRISKEHLKAGPDTISLCSDFAAFIWGPTMDNLGSNRQAGNKYNVYVVVSKQGEWNFGVRYFDRCDLNREGMYSVSNDVNGSLSKTVRVVQRVRTNGTSSDSTTFELESHIQLGDECEIKVKI